MADLDAIYNSVAQSSNSGVNLDAIYNQVKQSAGAGESGGQRGSFGQPLIQMDNQESGVESQPSAVNPLERAFFKMGDRRGVEDYLKKKFTIVKPQPDGDFHVGNSMNDLRPVDPNGLFNDFLGEIAEFVPSIPVIGAGVAGGLTGGVPGAVGATAATSAAMKGIGYASGINKQDPWEAGVDVAIDTIAQGAAEALNIFLKSAGPRIFHKGFGLIKKGVDSSTPLPAERADKFVNVARIFKATAGIDEEHTLNYIKYLNDGVALKDAASPQKLLGIVDDFAKSVTDKEKVLGRALGETEKVLLSKAGYADVPTKDLQQSVLSTMNELGLIDENGVLTKAVGSSRDQSTLVKLFERLNPGARESITGRPTFDASSGKLLRQERVPVLNLNPGAKIKSSELIGLEKQLRSVKESTNDDNIKRLYGNLIHGNQDESFGRITVGIKDEISKIAQKAGATEYIAQRKSYASFKSMMDRLGKMGIDPKHSLMTTENLTRGASNMAEVLRRELGVFDKQAGTNFINRMEIWDTANAFKGMNAQIMRLNTVVSMLSLGSLGALLPQSPEGKLAFGAGGLAAGLALGTREGAAMTIRAGAKLGKSAIGPSKTLSRLVQRGTSPKVQRTSLSYLAHRQGQEAKEGRQPKTER